MPIRVQIPAPMRQHTDGLTAVEVSGATVQAALDAVAAKYPALAQRLLENGQVRRFVNIYLNDEDIRYLDNLKTPTKDGDELNIVPAVARVADMAKHDEDEDPEEIEADEEGPASSDGEVPDGAAVFPVIPAELGVNPLLLAVVHALVFLAGSAEHVVAPPAADEAVQSMANYLQRLEGPTLTKVREDMACLTSYARQSKWPKQLIRALKNLLNDCGLEVEDTE